jgi:hypothetical protein
MRTQSTRFYLVETARLDLAAVTLLAVISYLDFEVIPIEEKSSFNRFLAGTPVTMLYDV